MTRSENQLLTPAQVQAEIDRVRKQLEEAVREVADFMGMSFQDEPWWPEVVALHKTLNGGFKRTTEQKTTTESPRRGD